MASQSMYLTEGQRSDTIQQLRMLAGCLSSITGNIHFREGMRELVVMLANQALDLTTSLNPAGWVSTEAGEDERSALQLIGYCKALHLLVTSSDIGGIWNVLCGPARYRRILELSTCLNETVTAIEREVGK